MFVHAACYGQLCMRKVMTSLEGYDARLRGSKGRQSLVADVGVAIIGRYRFKIYYNLYTFVLSIVCKRFHQTKLDLSGTNHSPGSGRYMY